MCTGAQRERLTAELVSETLKQQLHDEQRAHALARDGWKKGSDTVHCRVERPDEIHRMNTDE